LIARVAVTGRSQITQVGTSASFAGGRTTDRVTWMPIKFAEGQTVTCHSQQPAQIFEIT